MAIDTTHRYPSRRVGTPLSRSAPRVLALLVAAIGASAVIALPALALAGQSSTGKPAFLPCTRCHPVYPGKVLPNGFKKHEITLEQHDILGKDEEACVACHDSPQRDPGMLIAPDGSRIPITGDVSRVCQRCHMEKYREWQAGIHGKREPKCSAAGCHDPHSPSWIYMAALPPFQGTGVEIRAVAPREPFKPLPGPPVQPEVYTPVWLAAIAAIGAIVSIGLAGLLIAGRTKR